jgi:hypothetical protein
MHVARALQHRLLVSMASCMQRAAHRPCQLGYPREGTLRTATKNWLRTVCHQTSSQEKLAIKPLHRRNLPTRQTARCAFALLLCHQSCRSNNPITSPVRSIQQAAPPAGTRSYPSAKQHKTCVSLNTTGYTDSPSALSYRTITCIGHLNCRGWSLGIRATTFY